MCRVAPCGRNPTYEALSRIKPKQTEEPMKKVIGGWSGPLVVSLPRTVWFGACRTMNRELLTSEAHLAKPKGAEK